MNKDFDLILEHCLSELAAGRTVQDCLAEHPDLAPELAPLLLMDAKLRAIRKPTLPKEAKARIEARLLDAIPEPDRQRPRVKHPWRFRPGWQWAILALGAVLALILLLTAVVDAAIQILPGSPLYFIKRTTEAAQIWLAPTPDEIELHLRFARLRLDETEALLAQGLFKPTILEAMTEETEIALVLVEELPPALALPLLEDILALTDDQQHRLRQMLSNNPSNEMRKHLAAALQNSEAQANRTRALVGALRPEPAGPADSPQPPGQTKTPQPPGQTKTPQPPGQTKTPEPPGQTKTPEPPGQTKTPQPPGQTKTPQPPGQTKTPQPPGQTKTPEPPGQTKTPQPPGQTKTPEPPKPTKKPPPPKPTKKPPPTKKP